MRQSEISKAAGTLTKPRVDRKLSRLIGKIDLAVERSDYGGEKQDKALVNLISESWPVLEPHLRGAAGLAR